MKKHWYEDEVPKVARSSCYHVNFFPRAARLQLVAVAWDNLEQRERPGLTFTLRLSELNPEAVALIREALDHVPVKV